MRRKRRTSYEGIKIEAWRYIDLGYREPYIAQTFYEAIAESVHIGESPNTLLLVQPDSPYVCIGYHQDLKKEIDTAYCREHEIPIIRRSQGGGATILDRDQVFYQVVTSDSGVIPRDVEAMFKTLLEVTAETYNRLGVQAQYKPLNDVVTNGRKISGNGAGLYKTVSILVGNIILDLPYREMARVLKVPDEKFRDKMAKTMKDWVTNLKRELGAAPSPSRLKNLYTQVFQEKLNIDLITSKPSDLEWRIFDTETKPRHTSQEWLNMHDYGGVERPGRAVKIAGDLRIAEADHKAGKLIRIRAKLDGEKIIEAQITGDFFAIPKEAIDELAEELKGEELEEENLKQKIKKFYRTHNVTTPGIEIEDLVEGFLKL